VTMAWSTSRRLGPIASAALLALVCSHAGALAQEDSAADVVVGGLIVAPFLLGIYFVPAVIAVARSHPNRWAILTANVLLGLTGVGWIVCLVWSLTAVHGSAHGSEPIGDLDRDERIAMRPRRPDPDVDAIAEELGRLKDLADRNAISQDEYSYLKLRLLRGVGG
jgi:hypothetical protein